MTVRDGWADTQTDGWMDDGQIDIRQTDRHIDRQTHRQTDRRTDRQTDILVHGWMAGKTDRHAEDTH